MSHEPFETHVAAYALGALDGEDRVQLEEHLARGCTACAETLQEFAETLADVGREAPPIVPPAHVKAALVRRVVSAAPARSVRRWRRWRWALATAAGIVGVSAFTAGFVASRYEARIGAMARETAAIRADLRRQEAALKGRLAVAQAVLGLMRDPATRVVVLGGRGPAPHATGRIVWHDVSGGYLFVANLPPAPTGKAYELWTIGDGQPRPAGRLSLDASGGGSQPVSPAPGAVRVFAVTLEPEAGVPSPTGPMVLVTSSAGGPHAGSR